MLERHLKLTEYDGSPPVVTNAGQEILDGLTFGLPRPKILETLGRIGIGEAEFKETLGISGKTYAAYAKDNIPAERDVPTEVFISDVRFAVNSMLLRGTLARAGWNCNGHTDHKCRRDE